MDTLDQTIDDARQRLSASLHPLFFFDDDPDGLTSFLLLYRFAKKGKGVIIKSTPELNESFVRKIDEYCPDLIFVLDKPIVSPGFLNEARQRNIPVIWIDHHPPQAREHVSYLNPRLWNDEDNRPTSYWCWRIARQEAWIASVGMVGDWHLLPDVREALAESSPDLLSPDIIDPAAALFAAPIGHLVKIMAFNLKGKISEVNASIKILTRIEDPAEILEQTTPRGKFLFKKFEKVNSLYEAVKSDIKVSEDPIIFYSYKDNKTSFTSELSNELLFSHPEKVILIAREKGGEMKCSIRAAKHALPPILKEALTGLEGYGGGHDHACGACIKKKDFPAFLRRFEELLSR